MNIIDLFRKHFYDLFVVLSLIFAVPFILAGSIGYLWAFVTLSFSLGLRLVAKIARDLRLMRLSVINE